MNLVLVTGAPGAGKTTLAVPLAATLGFEMVRKDAIKEALDDVIAPSSRTREWSQTLGRLTYDVMWAIAPYFSNLVLECNLYPKNEEQRNQIGALSACPVEIFCRCPPTLAAARFAERAETRHPVHVDRTISLERLKDFDFPLGLGAVREVDTTRPVDIEALARWVTEHLMAESL